MAICHIESGGMKCASKVKELNVRKNGEKYFWPTKCQGKEGHVKLWNLAYVLMFKSSKYPLYLISSKFIGDPNLLVLLI
jgi:hypothetical protein